MNDTDRRDTLKTGTGIAWEEWLKLLEPHREENHTRLAEAAYQIILAQGKSSNPAWWAQSAAVSFERHIGRRLPGQQNDGTHSASISKTLSLAPEESLARWQALLAGITHPREKSIIRSPQVSRTEKWLYWRMGLEDMSNVSVNIQAKPGGKTVFTINHDRIQSQAESERWRGYWKDLILKL